MNAHPSVFPCASRDKEVAGYVLSHSLSPTMIAEYKTILPDKKMLQTKLHRCLLRMTLDWEKKSPDNFQPLILATQEETDSAIALLLTNDTFASRG